MYCYSFVNGFRPGSFGKGSSKSKVMPQQ